MAGMVAETGEATAKFLHSVARGEGGSEKSEMDKLAEARAARGLQRVATLPRHTTAIQQMSTELVRPGHRMRVACLLVLSLFEQHVLSVQLVACDACRRRSGFCPHVSPALWAALPVVDPSFSGLLSLPVVAASLLWAIAAAPCF